ncbi:MAG: SGNH/GDSL hydrolase family protein [Myxococcota bacterium]
MPIRERIVPLLLLLSILPYSLGCERKREPPPSGSSSLPNVVFIGDSISRGYYPYVEASLKDIATPHRPPGNHSATWEGLAHLDEWLEGPSWDVVHFNFGLHDIHRSSLEQYEQNLERIVKRLQQTGAKLVFATSTPVLEGTPRFDGRSSEPYNQVALRVMSRAGGVEINDLHALAVAHPEYQRPRDLHFTDEGYAALGEQVAQSIRKTLEVDRAPQGEPRNPPPR